VRELVRATARIAGGDYAARLEPTTSDEVAGLVRSFNAMASALAGQRADLERRRDYIETLLRQVTTGVVSLDTDGRIVTLNPAATTLLAPCSADLLGGARLREVLRASAAFAPLAEALVSAAPGERVDVDLMLDDVPRRYSALKVGLRRIDGEGFGTMVLLHDVTDLMRSNQLAAWAEMARAIAHEIKNPLTPIQLSTEHLQRLMRDRGYAPSAEERACLDTILKQVRALHGIAGEFSAYAKLPALAREPADPAAFLRAAVGPYRAASPPGVTIEERYEPSPRISIDPRVLSRAVVNLLENALQAMPEGGVVTISARPSPDGGTVELAVADTGVGLAPGVRSRLFEPYFSTKSTGTGLGLAIARRAVEAHGGTIEVSGRPGGDTIFRIRIPGYTAEDG
jgi:two-component system nitrogen regulation sensor histidine kinase NtrY